MIKGVTKARSKKTVVETPTVPFPAMTVRENKTMNFSPSAVELLDNTHVLFSTEPNGDNYVIPCTVAYSESTNPETGETSKTEIIELVNINGEVYQIGKASKRALPKTGNVQFKDVWNDLVAGTDGKQDNEKVGNVYRLVAAEDAPEDVIAVANNRPVYKLEFAFKSEEEAIEQGTVNTNHVA